MKRLILLTILFLVLFELKAQSKRNFSFGLGFSSTLPVQETLGRDAGLPVTFYFDIKYKRHEILIGPDLYAIGYLNDKDRFPLIIGGQGEYRYHFLKSAKKYNFFLNTTFQYVQFQNSCDFFVKTYDYSVPPICTDYEGEILKNRSLINTYGFGLECNFLKRFYAYSIIGFGYNYAILNELDGSPHLSGNRINIIGSFRIGISFSIYKRQG